MSSAHDQCCHRPSLRRLTGTMTQTLILHWQAFPGDWRQDELFSCWICCRSSRTSRCSALCRILCQYHLPIDSQSCDTEDIDGWVWEVQNVFHLKCVGFSIIIFPCPFHCSKSWRAIVLSSYCADMGVWTWSQFPNKHFLVIADVHIRWVVNHNCGRISVKMGARSSMCTPFINVENCWECMKALGHLVGLWLSILTLPKEPNFE